MLFIIFSASFTAEKQILTLQCVFRSKRRQNDEDENDAHCFRSDYISNYFYNSTSNDDDNSNKMRQKKRDTLREGARRKYAMNKSHTNSNKFVHF